jgi:hypothetical protein
VALASAVAESQRPLNFEGRKTVGRLILLCFMIACVVGLAVELRRLLPLPVEEPPCSEP